MPSPFPGMDPYLEQFWGDIHHRFITYACDQLQITLPGDLRDALEQGAPGVIVDHAGYTAAR